MKLAIITFHDANNYGAVLQAFALNETLNEYGKCNIINYYNPYFHRQDEIKSFKQRVKKFIYGKSLETKNNSFDRFRRDYLNIVEAYVKKEQLFDLALNYDFIVSGSDQVWNLKCSGNNDTYFLDFVNDNSKKISYSASFGSSKPDLDEKHLNYIKQFKKISVREKTGYDFLTTQGITSVQTCDPVFLLKKEKWNKLTTKIDDNYILIYEVVNGKNMIDFAKKISKSTGLKIKIITSSNKPIFGIETIRDAGPLEWLSLVKNAAYVITNSFHGLAFSLIFNKQFFIELLTNSDSNTRMIELLDYVKLNNRIITDNMSENEIIDFKKVNSVLDEFTEKSICYIESFVGEKNEKQNK